MIDYLKIGETNHLLIDPGQDSEELIIRTDRPPISLGSIIDEIAELDFEILSVCHNLFTRTFKTLDCDYIFLTVWNQ